jgi:hypothetical protein
MARVTADSMSAVAAPASHARGELITGSTRRILWIVGLFRAVCGALLLGLALMLDLRTMNVDAPNSFLTAASLYFVFGLAAFGWIQQERVQLPLIQTLFALVSGDIFFIALMIIAGDRRCAAADPAVSAACRQRVAAAHADGVLSRGAGGDRPAQSRGLSRVRRRHPRSAAVPDGTHLPRLLRDGRHRRRHRSLHDGVGGARRTARHRRCEP